MRTWKALCVPVLALVAATACVISVDGWDGSSATLWGQDVDVHDGYLVVDDVRLDHVRWEDVELPTAGLTALTFGTASEPVRLSGADGDTARLHVRVYSEFDGDGAVLFEEGRLVARSERGTVFINSIEGSIPRSIPLTVATGIGPIALSGVAAGVALKITTGTGDMELDDVAPSDMEFESGTGDLVARGGGAAALVANTGTGDVHLKGGRWGSIQLETGTGDLRITDCETASVHFESGTGDLVLDGGSCGKAVIDSGVGDLVLRGGAEVTSFSER